MKTYCNRQQSPYSTLLSLFMDSIYPYTQKQGHSREEEEQNGVMEESQREVSHTVSPLFSYLPFYLHRFIDF